ncbi:unnamed protein product [Phaedon cochleariae]|uniref:Nucleoside diphosphate kinase n=1 Tax=Phaedon cochleariae TaxID=80249 RepID=A0A9P0GVA6_PHACE|nr:unnamed protein product [Phaedon cochleariae]
MAIWQLTMAIIKPHIIKNPVSCTKIKELILSSNFKIVLYKRKTISICEAEDFYYEHQHKFFYNRLLTFITSGPSDILVLTKENAIADWRRLMGPTKVFKAQFEAANTIRGQYGLSDTRNATHGSDSEQSAEREIKIFFPEFNMDKWFGEKEPLFRSDKVIFLEDQFKHEVVLR